MAVPKAAKSGSLRVPWSAGRAPAGVRPRWGRATAPAVTRAPPKAARVRKVRRVVAVAESIDWSVCTRVPPGEVGSWRQGRRVGWHARDASGKCADSRGVTSKRGGPASRLERDGRQIGEPLLGPRQGVGPLLPVERTGRFHHLGGVPRGRDGVVVGPGTD